jgi:20S proteasome subunit beta 3
MNNNNILPSRRRHLFMVLLAFFLFILTSVHASDQATTGGGSMLAMAGTDCVALAVDKRFARGPALVAIRPVSVLMQVPRVLVAFTGLDGDVAALQHELLEHSTRRNNNNEMSVTAMTSLTSHILYNQRNAPYSVEPIVAGLRVVTDASAAPSSDKDVLSITTRRYVPFLCSMDCIWATSHSAQFCCAGAASASLHGTAEALWKPDLNETELVQVCARAFSSAIERDCTSGYGAVIYLLNKDGIVEYDLASRND